MTKTSDGKPPWGGPGCKPLPFIEVPWSVVELEQFSISTPDSRTEIIEHLSELQNVHTLSKLLPLLAVSKEEFGSSWRRVLYAVTHMLVDGAGNEDFAKDWLAHLGHTPEQAYEHASAGWRAVVSMRPQIEVQRFIGTACVAGSIFEQYGGATSGNAMDLCWYMLESSTPHRVDVLEEVLRHKYPDQLPDAALDSSNGELVCIAERFMLRQPTFLEAIVKVYGTDHQVVGSQMREAFVKSIDSNRIDMQERSFWKSLQIWGREAQAEALMRATFNDKLSSDDDQTRTPMFEAAMNGAGPVLGREIVQTAVMLGLDVNRAYGPNGERFIDVAVDRSDPELFTWLIARGADPELNSTYSTHPLSAVDRLEKKLGSFAPQIVKAANEMNDVLLKWRAHREAQRVIADLDLDNGQKMSI